MFQPKSVFKKYLSKKRESLSVHQIKILQTLIEVEEKLERELISSNSKNISQRKASLWRYFLKGAKIARLINLFLDMV